MRRQYRDLGVRVVELAPPAVDTELGVDRRADPSTTHGGRPTDEFVAAALAGLSTSDDEVLVGFAALARESPERAYAAMNPDRRYPPRGRRGYQATRPPRCASRWPT